MTWLCLCLTMLQAHAINKGPNILLKEGVSKLVDFQKSGKTSDRTATMNFIETEISPYFDFNYMAKWSAGRAYNRLNDKTKAQMAAKIKSMLLKSLAKNLTVYSKRQIRFFRPRMGRGEVKISLWIAKPGSYPTKLGFRFYLSENGWKIFDVSANGSSAVVYYRKYFRQMLR